MKLKIAIIIGLFLLLSGCIRRQVIEVPVKDSTAIMVVKEIEIKEIALPADSAVFEALFKCDSLGQAYLAELTNLQGERVKQSASINGGKITVRANDNATKRVERYARDSTFAQIKEVPVYIEVPVTTNILTRLQKAQVYLGRILLLLVAIIAVIKFNPIKFRNAEKH
jgi:hypothetical protein